MRQELLLTAHKWRPCVSKSFDDPLKFIQFVGGSRELPTQTYQTGQPRFLPSTGTCEGDHLQLLWQGEKPEGRWQRMQGIFLFHFCSYSTWYSEVWGVQWGLAHVTCLSQESLKLAFSWGKPVSVELAKMNDAFLWARFVFQRKNPDPQNFFFPAKPQSSGVPVILSTNVQEEWP